MFNKFVCSRLLVQYVNLSSHTSFEALISLNILMMINQISARISVVNTEKKDRKDVINHKKRVILSAQ